MRKSNIQIIDLSPMKTHAKTLHELIEKNAWGCIQMGPNPVIRSEGAVDRFLRELNPYNVPDLFFLVVILDEYEFSKNLLGMIKDSCRDIPVIIVADDIGQVGITELLKHGATDFVIPPLNDIDIVPRVIRLMKHPGRKDATSYNLKERIGLARLIGKHPVFLEEVNKIPQIARCDANVLITGETGTGKDLCARSVHYLSARSGMPFVPVNCGAIPKELVENELFGHAEGSYTGASSSRPGLILEAQGGTLFLDEIDNLPLSSQVKILRFLQEKEFRPIGSTRTRRADVRVIAATNIDLERPMKEGRFRHDLFYRLNIISLNLPPLRSHKEDIPLLAEHFVKKYTVEHGREISGMDHDALRKLVLHDWPGNVRELENCLERAIIFSKGDILQGDDIMLPEVESTAIPEPFHVMKSRVIAEFEKEYIQSLLLASRGNITRAANTAQKNRRAFWELIRKHGIDADNYKPRQT
jgi:DNA-binding NtrC family response regulator